MSSLFYNLGRKLGRAAVPALRKSKWLWQSVAGTEEESIRAEVKFGQALAEAVRARIADDPESGEMALVGAIGQRLGRVSGDTLRPFRVETVRSGSPNAMSLPGGFIFVDVALLELCEWDKDELAFIIGHEMAHVIRRHTFDRILRRVGVEMISTLLGRGALGQWLTRSGMDLLRSAHSQDVELEADEMGTDLSQRAGFDRQAAVRLFKRLQALRSTPEGVGDFFGSHPPERVRMAHLRAYWEEAS